MKARVKWDASHVATSADFVLLADGSSAQIRPATELDRVQLRALHARASDESIYRRFFSANRTAAQAFVDVICTPRPGAWSLVAVHGGRIVGVATATETGEGVAEVAFLVDESLHGIGIGTALLEKLAAEGRRRGLSGFSAEVLTDNLPMLRVIHDAGFSLDEHREYGVVSLTMDLTLSPEAVAAAARRERQAQRRSLTPLFEPKSVAVLGVSRRRGRIGREVLENIKAGEFEGALFAVGHRALQMPGVTCLSCVEELPVGVDHVVVALPATDVEAALVEVVARGARSCVVLTSGMAERGESGAALQRRLAAIAREHDTRLVGPNCFGVSSSLRRTRLDATFGAVHPRPGTIAVASQSGGVGIALLEAAHKRDRGIACFVSLGNQADVSGTDLLAAWTDDPAIGAAALYLESFHDPRRFARTAAEFSRAKPLFVVFGGSSAAGTRAGESHTAANATPTRALQALFRAAGVVDVDGIDDLVDTAALLTEQPLPQGPRLGVLANAGGLGIMAADAASRRQLDVPMLSGSTRSNLEVAVEGLAGTSNPVDLGAAAGPDSYANAARILMRTHEVDALLVIAATTAVTDLDSIRTAVEEAAADTPAVPCLTVLIGAAHGRPRRTTEFRSIDGAVSALSHAVRYASWRSADSERPSARPGIASSDEDSDTGADGGPGRWLDLSASERLLGSVGVRCAPWRVGHSKTDVTQALRELGYPLVVKTGDAAVVHKTERHLVHTGLRTRTDVMRAVRDVHAVCGSDTPVLLQPELSGPELAVGFVRDPHFGPLVMVASGGTSLELWGDQTFLMPPFAAGDVRAALQSLRTWRLLTGFRGGKPLDVDPVIDLVMSVGRLALERPELRELDLNPVILTDEGPVCVDVKARSNDRPEGYASPGSEPSRPSRATGQGLPNGTNLGSGPDEVVAQGT